MAGELKSLLAQGEFIVAPGVFEMLSARIAAGFRFVVMDVGYTEGDRVIELQTPEEIYDLAALLRDNDKYVVESIWSRATGDQAVAVSTTRLHNIAGRYTGKDDPVLLARAQMHFPATGEILAPYAIGHFVGGAMRGSHQMPLMPVKQNATISYFDGPPVVSCAAYSVHEGRLSECIDAFDHPLWDEVRRRVADKALEMRRQGFSGPAMLPMGELEYTGVMKKLEALDKRFKIRA